ncbi:hypothetical protein PG997_008167 [Apiospora hydei]|uniref:Uncharacterized protein n=1 Tax=Apiospora hydei TaxID=1337664 RepID=A0ABR1WA22_9PEZI
MSWLGSLFVWHPFEISRHISQLNKNTVVRFTMVAGQNLGPLTAAPTLPSTCADELDQVYKINTYPGYYLLQGPPEAALCYPSAYAGVRSHYYYPAASCPFGFTPACTSTNGESETIYTCCPTQFDFICQSTNFYQWETTLGCTIPINSDLTTTWTMLDVQDGKTVASKSLGFQGGVNAFSIQVRFQSSDLITPGSFEKTNRDKADFHSRTNKSIYGGLSAGAAAGIAVGAVALLLAVVGALFMMLRRRRRQKQIQPAPQIPDSYYPSPAPKYVSEVEAAPQMVYEAPNTTYELEGVGPRATT